MSSDFNTVKKVSIISMYRHMYIGLHMYLHIYVYVHTNIRRNVCVTVYMFMCLNTYKSSVYMGGILLRRYLN